MVLSCTDDTEVLELDDNGNSIVDQIINTSNAMKRTGNLTASMYTLFSLLFINIPILINIFV